MVRRVVRAGYRIVIGGDGELTDQPAVRQGIVEHGGIAVVGLRTRSAQTGKQRADLRGVRQQRRTGRFVVHLKNEVDGLHVVVGTDVTVGVGGRDVATEL